MAHPDTFPGNALPTVAAEIGMRLPVAARGTSTPEIAETFSVWMLGLDAIAKSDQDISTLATPIGRWHHQIKLGHAAPMLAQSRPPGPQDTKWTITQVMTSPLAARIDKAIGWIDQHVTNDPLVRLLTVPAYHLHALWLLEDEASQVLVVDMRQRHSRLKYETLYSFREFLETLAKERHIIGIPPTPSRRG